MADLGFIGMGIMGKPMAGHLVKAGHKVHVFSRSPGPVEELADSGAVACNSAREVAETSRHGLHYGSGYAGCGIGSCSDQTV